MKQLFIGYFSLYLFLNLNIATSMSSFYEGPGPSFVPLKSYKVLNNWQNVCRNTLRRYLHSIILYSSFLS